MANNQAFDVFLSHNSADKPAVELLARRLEDEAELKPFLDKWHLIPGSPWQEELEQALDHSRTCAVFIGPTELGSWENEEMRSALDDRVKQPAFRVIPVLLPGATMPERGTLPRFLSRLTWVDFRCPAGVQDAEAFHRLVAGIRGRPPGRDPEDSLPTSSALCPYRGLEVFDEAHAPFFFGREAVTQHLVEALRVTRFLAVIGPSGSGKSSVVRAGLLPHLRAGALPCSDHWRYLVFKPGAHPLQELALHLARGEKHDETPTHVLHLLNNLEADERALHLQVRLSLEDRASEERFCICVDQFEEVFTLCQDQAERVRFIETLRYASTIAGGQTVIVITLRADFVAPAAQYTPLAELLSAHQFLLSPMEEEDLRHAIEEPARQVGVRWEEGLVEAILQDVGREPGVLPLMEHALLQLWEKRRTNNVMTLHAYEETGGVRGALAKRAEEIFASFTPEQQQMARPILLRLTQPGEGAEDTRRRATIAELLTNAGDSETVEAVVRTLADARLLTTSGGEQTDERVVEVSHEALIRGWPRLRRWIDDDRAGLRVHRRLTEVAQEWQRLNQDAGVLYRGARLAAAVEWQKRNEDALNELERAFLKASVRLVTKERLRRWLTVGIVVILLLGITAVLLQISAMASQSVRQSEAAEKAERDTQVERVLSGLRQQAVVAQLATLHGHTGPVTSLAFSPDGQWLVTASRDATVRVWEEATGKQVAVLKGHQASVNSAVFTPDGNHLVTASDDNTARVWDARTAEPTITLVGHKGSVNSAVVSPDGNSLITGSADGTVRVWNMRSGYSEAELVGHKGPVTSLAFSPDGRLMVTTSTD